MKKLLTALCLSAAIAIVVVFVCKKKNEGFHTGIAPQVLTRMETVAKPTPYYSEGLFSSDNSVNFQTIEQSNGLPIACVSTLGGDIMMCPESGICPLNGARCQPTSHSKPCCTDDYPPKETWYYPDRPPVADYMYM